MAEWSNVISRGRATVARQAHNLKIAGSIPAPATRSDLDIIELLENLPILLDDSPSIYLI